MATTDPTGALTVPSAVAPLLRAARESDPAAYGELLRREPKALMQEFGSELGAAQERADHLHELLEHASGLAAAGGEAPEALASLLAVLTEYSLATSNSVFRVRSLSMAMLEQANLVAPSQQRQPELSQEALEPPL